MKHRVAVLAEAEDDLLDIYDHITATSSVKAARDLLRQLKSACRTLERVPRRGHYPPELECVGITMYREIHHRQYRILYEVLPGEVHIHAILDGRRNLKDLLERRLLRS